MWKKTKLADDWEPLPGVPWRDMSDGEFRDVAKEYAIANDFPARSLHNSGFFEHVEDADTKAKDAAPAAAPAPEGDK